MPPDQVVADALADGDRCVLAVRGGPWPVMASTVFWSDGDSVWLTAAADSAEVTALREQPDCALWIPVPARSGSGPARAPGGRGAVGEHGAVVRGRARVFGAADPVGLTFHGATISAAMTALALKQAGAVLGYARDAAQAVPRLAVRRQVVVRVTIEHVRVETRPASAPGVAPALPVVVPAQVRRALAGERRVVVAVERPGGLSLTPALWSAGFALEPAAAGGDVGHAGFDHRRPAPIADSPRAPVAVAVDTPPRRRPTEAVGLVLAGTLNGRGAVEPATATWWLGFETASAPIPSTAGVTLPD